MEEDLALRYGRDPQTGEFLVSGTGQLHVEIAVAKLKNRYHVEVILHPPKVPYRETIIKPAEGHGRHKKQTGGRGQFADCKITIEPLPRGEDFEFVDEIFGGSIPHNYRPAVEKGIQEARGARLPGGLSGGRLPGPPDRRPVPRRRLLGAGVQDRRLAGLQGGDGSAPGRPSSSR